MKPSESLIKMALWLLVFTGPVCADPLDRPVHDPDARFREEGSGAEGLEKMMCGPMGVVIRANGGKIPTTTMEWIKALRRFGKVRGVIVPFSRAPSETSLGKYRLLLSVEPPQAVLTGGPSEPGTKMNLAEKFYMGIVFDKGGTHSVEAITLDGNDPAKFNFGEVNHFDSPGKVKADFSHAKGQKCLACHKNEGPIFSIRPWSGTNADIVASMALLEQLNAEDKGGTYRAAKNRMDELKDKFDQSTSTTKFGAFVGDITNDPLLSKQNLILDGEDTGIPLVSSPFANGSVVTFDKSVRDSNQAHLLNQVVGSLDAKPRAELVKAAVETALSGLGGCPNRNAAQVRQTLQSHLQNLDFAAQAPKFTAARSNLIRDFNPVTGRSEGGFVATGLAPDSLRPGDQNRTHVYNSARELGKAQETPKEFRASNAEAFIENPVSSADFASQQTGRIEKSLGLVTEGVGDLLSLAAFVREAAGVGAAEAAYSAEFARHAEKGPGGTPRLSPFLAQAKRNLVDAARKKADEVGAAAQKMLCTIAESPEMKTLYAQGRLPSREEFLKASLSALERAFQDKPEVAKRLAEERKGFESVESCKEPPKKLASHETEKGKEPAAKSTCVQCHEQNPDDPDDRLAFPFDAEKAADQEKWTTELEKAAKAKNGARVKQLVDWAGKIRDRLNPDNDMGVMPPEGTKFDEKDRKALIQFFGDLETKYRKSAVAPLRGMMGR
jgi:hypothetical protein